MKLGWIAFVALAGCSANGHAEFFPCSNASCVADAGGGSNKSLLCQSDCSFTFACVSDLFQAQVGQCVRLCVTDADCTHNYFPANPPKCSHAVDLTNVAPYGWCVDLPKVTQ